MSSSAANVRRLEPSKLTESIKSMEWGIEQNQHSRHYTTTGITEQREESTEHHIQVETTRPQSNAFKKDKTAQISKLNELKKEYDILKNIRIEDSMIRSRKSTNPIQPSSSSSSLSSQSKSIKSRSSHKHIKTNHVSHDFQRKQLELMLANSMNKIEELLRAEVEYKRKIHQLSQNASLMRHDESAELIHQHQTKEKELHETITSLKDEENRLRGLNRDLSSRLGQLQGDLAVKEAESRHLRDAVRKAEEAQLLEKEKYLNSDIEIKRLKMEKEILEKEKDSQIHRLERILSTTNTHNSSQVHTEILKLSEEIKLKDERYNLLLREMESLKSSRPDLTSVLIQKIEGIEGSHESAIKQQIEMLKKDILKFRNNADNQDIIAPFQAKISELQRMINEENSEKMKFLEDIRELNESYERLKKENKRLKEEIEGAENEGRKMKKEITNLRTDMQVSENAKLTLSYSQMDQNTMLIRIKNMERIEEENKQLRSEFSDLKKSSREKESHADEKIRELLRKIDELEFEVERARKEGQFNLGLNNAKSRADLELVKNQEMRAYRERDEWKRQFQNMKTFYEEKLKEMKLEANRIGEQYSLKCTSKEEEIKALRTAIDLDLENMRKKHQEEQSGLLNRLESLTESNERLAQQNSRFIRLESQLYELRQQSRRMKSMNEAVDHLWQVKEAEYSNVNELMKELV